MKLSTEFQGIFTLVFMFLLSCSSETILDNPEDPAENAVIRGVWKEFVHALDVKNIKLLSGYTMDTIRCYPCLENTEEEQSELDRLRETKSNWFDEVYQKKIYISKDAFIRDDIPLLFDRKMIHRLKTAKTIYVYQEIKKVRQYEILVTTTEAGEIYPELEAAQHAFLFIKTPDGYRLSEISTIP